MTGRRVRFVFFALASVSSGLRSTFLAFFRFLPSPPSAGGVNTSSAKRMPPAAASTVASAAAGASSTSANGFHPRPCLSLPGRGDRRRRGGGRLRGGRGGRQHFLHGGFRLDIDSPAGGFGGPTGGL